MSLDASKVKDLSERMKLDVRSVIEKYANESAQIWATSPDPHIPVIAFMQMALANAGADYLIFSGAQPQEGFEQVVNITGQAMERWVKAVLKQHGIDPQQVEVEAKDKN